MITSKKVASTRDYVKALSEFVWNALDADAKHVSVDFNRNILGGLEAISIRDDGVGISKARAEHDFESLGESWKRQTSRTPLLAHAMHGKEGQGRLRFFSLAHKACWTSVSAENGSPLRLTIEIDSSRLATSRVSEPQLAPNSSSGTIVELAPLKDTFDWLTSEAARAEFSAIFAPYVLQYPGTVICYDDQAIDPDTTIERARSLDTQAIVCPGRVVRDLSLRVIEWKAKTDSRKSILAVRAGWSLAQSLQTLRRRASTFQFTPIRHFFRR